MSIELLQRAARTPSLEVAQRSVEALVDIAERTTSDSDDEHRDRLRASMIEMLERIAEDPKALVAGAATQEAKWLRMESLRATSDGPTRCSFTCKWIPPRAFPTYGEANTQKLRS